MPLFYWVYSKHMDLINTLLLKLCLGKKAEPLIVLGKKLSNNNDAVVKSLELYCFSPDAYFDDISEFEKDNCFIESVDDITSVDALVRALSSANAVVCVVSLCLFCQYYKSSRPVVLKKPTRVKSFLKTSNF